MNCETRCLEAAAVKISCILCSNKIIVVTVITGKYFDVLSILESCSCVVCVR